MVGFVLIGFVVYWTGWDTNWKVMSLVLLGLPVLVISRSVTKAGHLPLEAGHVSWFLLYVVALALVSFMGNYGNGLGLLPTGIDLLIITVVSLLIFRMALNQRLPNDLCNERIKIAMQASAVES